LKALTAAVETWAATNEERARYRNGDESVYWLVHEGALRAHAGAVHREQVMAVKRAVIAATVNQFGHPRGTAGSFAGRVNLARAPVDQLPPSLGGPFDAILTVNSRFWPAPTQQLDQLRRRLRLGGRIAIASQPRCPGATASTSREAARQIEALLQDAGYTPDLDRRSPASDPTS